LADDAGLLFPYDVLPAVDLDDAGMIRIGDKRVTPFSRLAKATPLTASLMLGSPFPYCQTMSPSRVTSIARLLFSSQMRMWPLSKSSEQFGLFS
jgi:hypothetical protein